MTSATERAKLPGWNTGDVLTAEQVNAIKALFDSFVAYKDVTNTFTAAGSNTNAPVFLSSIRPMVAFNETDAADDNKLWTQEANNERFIFAVRLDNGSPAIIL